MSIISNSDARYYKIYHNNSLLKSSDVAALLCPSCGGLLRDPVQVTACGDRFCRSCIEKIMSHRYNPEVYMYSDHCSIYFVSTVKVHSTVQLMMKYLNVIR